MKLLSILILFLFSNSLFAEEFEESGNSKFESSQKSSQVKITFRENVSIAHSNLSIADVISKCVSESDVCKETSGILIGATPLPGKEIIFTKEDFEKVLEKEWPNIEVDYDLTGVVHVTSPGVAISSEEIAKDLSEALDSYMDKRTEYNLKVKKIQLPSQILIRPIQHHVSFEDIDEDHLASAVWIEQNLSGYKTLSVKYIYDQTQDAQIFNIVVQFELKKKVPVAAQFMNAGEIITQDKIKEDWIYVRRNSNAFIESTERILNKELRVSTFASQPFGLYSIKNQVSIGRGKTVKLTLLNDGIKVVTSAKSLGSGAIGDTIEVLNVASNRKMKAKITSDETVEAVRTE